ncbi:MAG: IPT/TIG domain-containing protein [Thermoleophilaceae bacterium]
MALAAAVASTGVADARARAATSPVVKKVRPLKIHIGETLTITGSGFVKGKKKNTVVFMGPSKKVVWVKADSATTTTIKLKLPVKIAPLLTVKSGKVEQTRLRLRVISKRSGRSFTPAKISPIVVPKLGDVGVTPGPGGGPGAASADCDNDGIPNSVDPDADNDFLPNTLEAALGTDSCKADTDGDGVSDGYEYQAALNFNRNANSNAIPWPYPGKRAYPNPLDASDANVDFDGDSLTLMEEYTASFDPDFWGKTTVQPTTPPAPNTENDVMVVSYSDGDQTTDPPYTSGLPTGPLAPTDPNAYSGFDVNGNDNGTSGNSADTGDHWSFLDRRTGGAFNGAYEPLNGDSPGWMDYNGDGVLQDDEKDIDQDGLSNYDETHGPASGPGWWNTVKPWNDDGLYPLPYTGTNWLTADTDGDGVLDGADDQDHDGYTNIEELYPLPKAADAPKVDFVYVIPQEGVPATTHEFNPCLPNLQSPACMRHPVAGANFAPFKDQARQPTWNQWPRP